MWRGLPEERPPLSRAEPGPPPAPYGFLCRRLLLSYLCFMGFWWGGVAVPDAADIARPVAFQNLNIYQTSKTWRFPFLGACLFHSAEGAWLVAWPVKPLPAPAGFISGRTWPQDSQGPTTGGVKHQQRITVLDRVGLYSAAAWLLMLGCSSNKHINTCLDRSGGGGAATLVSGSRPKFECSSISDQQNHFPHEEGGGALGAP